jgi:hypothetical protein
LGVVEMIHLEVDLLRVHSKSRRLRLRDGFMQVRIRSILYSMPSHSSVVCPLTHSTSSYSQHPLSFTAPPHVHSRTRDRRYKSSAPCLPRPSSSSNGHRRCEVVVEVAAVEMALDCTMHYGVRSSSRPVLRTHSLSRWPSSIASS